jgi:hypothetical protein
MSARQATLALMRQLGARGISLSFDEVNTLRRAELTLQRWGELECGDSNEYGKWAIERNEQTGIPHMVRHHYTKLGDVRTTSTRIADKEKGALRRITAICKAHGLHYYHQTDPRGCALYVSNEPLPDHNYTRGVACCS